MKRTPSRAKKHPIRPEMRREYRFDYREARPNRFAALEARDPAESPYSGYNEIGAVKRKGTNVRPLPGSTFRARFSRGALRPLERLGLQEGEEVSVAIVPATAATDDWLVKTAGGWAGLVDCERLKTNIYDARLVRTRKKARL